MQFNSFQYLFFLPFIVTLHYLLPVRARQLLLLLGSYYFYMCWRAEYVLLIAVSTLVDYWAGFAIWGTNNKQAKKIWLGFSLIINLGILFGFKYFNFVSENVRTAFSSFDVLSDLPLFNVLLPIGISFYTFQSLSYTIDIYRGKLKPEKNLIHFALYVSFFPQLVAGPIERAGRLLPQLALTAPFNSAMASSGLRLILWGLFKKTVIADRLAGYVDTVYGAPEHFPGQAILIATIFFAFQIYCDFSGYSDMAVGSARLFGVNLMANFKAPYFASSLREFWQRWHISLSTWFRDYVYIPLGGRRTPGWRWQFNILITFIISGLWHGANWTFIAWGAFHGIGLLVSRPVGDCFKFLPSLIYRPLGVLSTFATVCVGWMLFRAENLAQFISLLKSTVSPDFTSLGLNVTGTGEFLLSWGVIVILLVVDFIVEWENLEKLWVRKSVWLRWLMYYMMAAGIYWFGVFEQRGFIYFQF